MDREIDDDTNQIRYFLLLNFFSFMLYLLYLEINPRLTNIWLRKDSDNIRRLSLGGLKDFLLYPLKEYRVWYPQLWDLNVFVSVPLISFTINIFKDYLYR